MPLQPKTTRVSINLRYLRLVHGYTQEEVADIVGLSRYTICRYEKGSRVPDILHLRSFATLYAQTIDALCNADLSGAFEGVKEDNQ